jgi:hypothetical protein
MKDSKAEPEFSLDDQAKGRCRYCLASAEMDCNCEQVQRKSYKEKKE